MKSIFLTPEFWINALAVVSALFLLPELQALLGPVHGPNALKILVVVNAVVNVLVRFFPAYKAPVTLFPQRTYTIQ